jgi:hypothetical protein
LVNKDTMFLSIYLGALHHLPVFQLNGFLKPSSKNDKSLVRGDAFLI